MIGGMRSRDAIAAIMALGAASAGAAETISKDLTSTLALLGINCQVVSSQRLGENDYLATCKDKNAYRVYVNKQGRVVAEKR